VVRNDRLVQRAHADLTRLAGPVSVNPPGEDSEKTCFPSTIACGIRLEAASTGAHMRLKTFKKGVHPGHNKSRTASSAIVDMPLPDTIVLPLSQHLGKPATPLKNKGDEVSVGELVCEAAGLISANIHSPVAGKIKRIIQKPLPGGRMANHMEITVDHEKTAEHHWEKHDVDVASLDRDTVVKTIAAAGIVGMGGATFPTHVKFSPPSTAKIDVLVVNGAECEPYLTCDHRLMLEKTREIMDALAILQHTYNFSQIIIGIENNKPDAVLAFEAVLKDYANLPASVEPLQVKYPQGAEKMLIHATTGRVVPAGALPLEVGVIVSNVATLYAIYEAFYLDKPLLDRVLTVTGSGISEAKNVRTVVGTPFDTVAEFCGGVDEATNKVVVGGPMMGVAVPTLDYSVAKGTSGMVFLTGIDIPDESPCIKCGKCVEVCPMNLMPLRLAAYAKAGKFADAKALHLADCFECGSCAFGCPAKIQLVAWIRYAKNYVRVKGI